MRSHIKALVVVLSLALISAWFFNSFFYSKLNEGNPAMKTLDELQVAGAPNFQAVDILGKFVELKSFSGKLVIVNFWASWCSPCIEEVPSLIRLAQTFKREIHIFAISGDNSVEDIKVFLKSFPDLHSENVTVLWDQEKKIMKSFGVMRLPESFILDKNQKLIKKISGTIDWSTPESIDYLKTQVAL